MCTYCASLIADWFCTVKNHSWWQNLVNTCLYYIPLINSTTDTVIMMIVLFNNQQSSYYTDEIYIKGIPLTCLNKANANGNKSPFL